jgi:hypothetical protein
MAKTPIRNVPTTLPHARIYLDDLEETEQILRDSSPRDGELEFTYEVDGTDRFTSLNEIAEHCDATSMFQMRMMCRSAHGYASVALIFNGANRPILLGTSSDSSKEDWERFSRIQQIFDARKDSPKEFIDSLSTLFIVVIFGILLILGAALGYSHWQRAAFYGSVLSISALLVWLLPLYPWLRRNRVYFRRIRATSREINQRRTKAIGQIGLVALGAALKALFDHIWPSVTKH